MRQYYIVFFLLVISKLVTAQVQLAEVFTDHMVLQRGKPVAVWGTASPNETVEVSFAGATRKVTASVDGKWKVKLPAMKASAMPRELTVKASNIIVLSNVLVGEVWLCSGQSNMEYPMDRHLKRYKGPKIGVDKAAEVLAGDKNPMIRFMYVQRKHTSPLPTTGWHETTDTTLRHVSAAGYFFAEELVRKLNVPVGIISSSWGGTRVEQWAPAWAYEQSPLFKDTVAGKKDFKIDGMEPGKMFASMLEPIIPFTMKGILWYQGESNAMIHDTLTFKPKTKLMLDTWKQLWDDPNLSFYYVQIAPFYYTKRKDKLEHGADLLPHYWEQQALCLDFPRSGMVVTTDLVDDLSDIHPGYKWEVGRRLSLWALAKDYKQRVVYSGPLYKSMKVKGNSIEISFNHVGGGLVSTDGQPLSWFSVAGADRRFYPAIAEIKGKKIIVSAPQVNVPVAVRFAWDETAMPNFANKENLPASPFRTDTW